MCVAWNLALLAAGPSFPCPPADLGPEHPGMAKDIYNQETHMISQCMLVIAIVYSYSM
jgi:hypothetical protein